jgi:pimeloyl-ACP methyl ester carboxylesterase
MPLTIKRATLSGHKPFNAKHVLEALLFIALLSALSTIKANASTYFDFRTSTGTAISSQGDGTLCSTGEIVCKYVVINLGRPAAVISGIKYYQLNMAGFNIMGGGCGSGALDIAVYNDAAYMSFDHAFALDGSGASPSFFSASVNFSVPADKFAQLIFGCNDGGGTAVTLIDGGPGTYEVRDINSIRYTGLPNLCVGDTPADCGATINTTEKVFDFENQSGSIGTDIGDGPLGLSIRLGQPKIAVGPGTLQIQFFQTGTGGCVDPGYSFQAFADSAYKIPVGTAFKLLATTDVAGNPITLEDYSGIVEATIFGALDRNKYYTFGFGSCDFSRPISIKGDPSGTYTCTLLNFHCYEAYYQGAFPYLVISPIVSQTGTITVTTNNVAATFTISNDNGNNFQGGGASFSQVEPPGTYTITFGGVPGFTIPDSQTKMLSGGGTVSFTGNYQVFIAPPTSLRATVGNGTITLDWNPSQTPNIDGYNIYLEQFIGDHFVSFGMMNAIGNPIPSPHFVIAGQFSDDVITNGTLYRLHVTAVKAGFESLPSDFALARPAQLALSQLPPPPITPILFLHGICLLSTETDGASYWKETRDFLATDLHWKDGGTLKYLSSEDPRELPPITENFVPGASFYTATFGNCKANYFVENPFTEQRTYFGRPGILHQADEVHGFIRSLNVSGMSQVNIVAHSMGGIAARSYIADNPGTNNLLNFITYGSPHWGVPFSWPVSPILDARSDGARDLAVHCDFDPLGAASTLDYIQTPFLEHLRQIELPNSIRYVNIQGRIPSDAPLIADFLGCLSLHWDFPIPTESADLVVPPHAPINQSIIVRKRTLITTDRVHTSQPSDFSAILCALDLNCMIYRTHSPVDIEITAPDGRMITRQLTEIPGASYMETLEESGTISATVLLPFPLEGEYSVKVVAKPDGIATDTYGLDVTRAGITTPLAQDQSVVAIPDKPYTVNVLHSIIIDIKPGNDGDKIELKEDGKIKVAILSTMGFDAPARVNTATLTFGHLGDEHSLAFCRKSGEDVNGDGLPDLVCHFFTAKTGFMMNDRVGILTGITKDGIPFVGTDPVRIIAEDVRPEQQ